MLVAQAEYLVRKYQLDKKRDAGPKKLENYRKWLVKHLKKEDDEYEAASKAAQDEVSENEKYQLELMRKELCRVATAAKVHDAAAAAVDKVTAAAAAVDEVTATAATATTAAVAAGEAAPTGDENGAGGAN